MKKVFYLLFILLLNVFSLNAQNKKAKSYLKLANKELSNLRYAYAIPLFKSYLSIAPKDSTVLKKISLTYLKLNQYDSALLYMNKAISNGIELDQSLPELYAVSKNYEKAIQFYNQLINQKRTKVSEARIFGFKNITNFYLDSFDYRLHNTVINTGYNEFNPIIYKDGLIFESNRIKLNKINRRTLRKAEFAWDGSGYSRLYYYPSFENVKTNKLLNYAWNEKKPLKRYNEFSNLSPNDSKKNLSIYDTKILAFNDSGIKTFNLLPSNLYNLGAMSITADGKKAYYTRNQSKSKGVNQLEIWEAQFKNGAWVNHKKMFFNRPEHSYFHPAITPDGKRLYYISDDPISCKGGTDLFYIDQNEDGSWKSTTNAGIEINTEGNELFPTFYEGNLYFSSNGHPGLGGLDIYRVDFNKGEIIINNLGYPVNSSKDDFSFVIKGSKGFFSTNRYGSDDIIGFNYSKTMMKAKGQILIDGKCEPGKKVFISKVSPSGSEIIVDSAILDGNCQYEFNVRPNNTYSLVVYDKTGDKYQQPFVANAMDLNIDSLNDYQKSIVTFDVQSREKQIIAQIELERSEREKEVSVMSKQYKLKIDSLQTLTRDFVVLHHPFDKMTIIEKDLPAYYKLIQRVKLMQNKRIVIVSATDCNGSDVYNEDLSNRRANRIFKTLSKLGNNEVIINHVGERELLTNCDEQQRDPLKQVENRYSYIFIIDK